VASKLDEMIAKVAVEAAGTDPGKMIASAREAAPQVTAEEAAKLPERWYPKVTSKTAGAPHLRDSWPRAWFEAVVEILWQKGKEALPPLLELLQRDGSTYHEMVILRLLRMAAAGVERKAILDKLKARLPTLHRTQVYAAVRDVVFWSERDPEPLVQLRPMAKVKVKDAEGDTIGTYIKQYEGELALLQAKRAPQKSADPLDEWIVSTAILALESDAFRAQAAAAARELGSAAAGPLAERLKKPDLSVLQSRAPSALSAHEATWCRAVLEILGHFGTTAIPIARSLLDSDDEYIREKSLRLVFLLAARQPGHEREVFLSGLRKRLLRLHHRNLRPIVSELLLDARSEPEVMRVLDELAGVKVADYGQGKIAIGDMVRALYVAPKPRASPSTIKQSKEFAEQLGALVVAKDFRGVWGMFSRALQKNFSAKKLAALVAKESKHSGAPEDFRYDDNDTTAAELREGGGDFAALPAHMTDANFRRWCCLQFLPEEGSEVDACFDWWMAVMEEKGTLKVGFFHITEPD
jgi:hypothetical protein